MQGVMKLVDAAFKLNVKHQFWLMIHDHSRGAPVDPLLKCNRAEGYVPSDDIVDKRKWVVIRQIHARRRAL